LSEDGLVCAAQVRDTLDGRNITIRARHIVNAAGVFSEQVESLVSGTEPQIQMSPARAFTWFSRKMILMLGQCYRPSETEDKRILFIVPWQSRIIFGTTDTGLVTSIIPLPLLTMSLIY